MKLEGNVARVTDASRGIGRAIALGLAAEGAHVVVHYVSRADAAQTVCEAIGSLGRDALPLRGDVAEAADVERMVVTALDHFGRLDVLVNNATIHQMLTFTFVWFDRTGGER